MWWLLLITYLYSLVNAQSGGVPPVGGEYNDRAPDGSYRFGFQTGDEGSHYHAAVANGNNQVAGRFGSRDPEKGGIVETQYTAGDRGFRARGPNIARKMDLSQNKIPYNPPVNPDSPYYNPTYSGYNDPNEDPSYSFGFRSPSYERKEASDSTGRVNGAYRYVDDAGEVHNVSYEAGADIGFNVKTPFPDSNPFPGTFYQGPPSHPGSKTVRGKTSIVQRNDGSYSFVSAGPDQRRSETSDSNRNVKGSYTYIDDKGQQRTVEYIAGPNIGYRIISKGLGVKFPPSPPFVPPYGFPDFSSTLPPLVTSAPDLSYTPGFTSSGGSSSGDLFGGGPTTRPPSFGGTGFGPSRRPPPAFGGSGFVGGSTTRPGGNAFVGGSGNVYNNPNRFGSTTTSKPSVFGNNDDLFGTVGNNRPVSTTTTTTTTTTTPSSVFGGSFTNSYNFNDLFGNDLSGGFTPSPSPPPSVSSQYIPSPSTPKPPQDYSTTPTPPTFSGYPDGRPQPGVPPFPYIPPPSFPASLPNNCCGNQPSPPAFSANTPPPPLQPPPPSSGYLASAFPEDDPSLPPRPLRPSLEDDFLTRPFSDLPPKYFGGDNYYKSSTPSPPSNFRKQSNDDSDFLSSNKNFRGLPVRAHVQSVDLKQYDSKLPPPGIALERGVMFPG